MNDEQNQLVFNGVYLLIGFIFGAMISHSPKNPIGMSYIAFCGFVMIFGLIYISFGDKEIKHEKKW